jgi:hypothetical protein
MCPQPRRAAGTHQTHNPGGIMSDPREPQELRPVIERRLLRAIFTAVGKLSREARGTAVVSDEFQFRACVALARLAPAVLRSGPREELVDPIHPAFHAQAYKWLDETVRARAPVDEPQRLERRPQQLLDDQGECHEPGECHE